MTYRLPLAPPPEITQEPHQCWSAAYESWSRATAQVVTGATAITEEQIESSMATYPGALSGDGGATMTGIGLLQRVGNMRLEGLRAADITEDFAERKMRASSYLYLVYYAHSRDGLFSHAVVIYGIDHQGLMIMDPGDGRGLMSRPARYYQNAIVMLLGTHVLA